MEKPRSEEFHLVVPNRLDTGFSKALCDGDCNVSLDIDGDSLDLPRADIIDLIEEGEWRDREERGSFLVVGKAKAYKNKKGKIERSLSLDFWKIQEDGTRAAKKVKGEKYVNGRQVK